MSFEADPLPAEIDHAVSLKLGGRTNADNLAAACGPCNQRKGPCIAAIDPTVSGRRAGRAFLFDPREDVWDEHFVLRGGEIVGRTPTGRATAALLRMNEPDRVRLRLDVPPDLSGPGGT